MSRVLALVEGQTEQAFVHGVLAPSLAGQGVFLSARLLGKPGRKGGVRAYDVVRRDIVGHLKEDVQVYCTTMFDFYGLPKGWRELGFKRARTASVTAARIENAMREDVCSELGSSFNAARFIPYIQLHEFEAVLFSGPRELADTIQRPSLVGDFQAIVKECGGPEAVDDGKDTAPSKRILAKAPNYHKVLHGPIAAQRIGLDTIRERCPHFAAWVDTLESLGQAQVMGA
jgi:hypothetical protein